MTSQALAPFNCRPDDTHIPSWLLSPIPVNACSIRAFAVPDGDPCSAAAAADALRPHKLNVNQVVPSKHPPHVMLAAIPSPDSSALLSTTPLP